LTWVVTCFGQANVDLLVELRTSIRKYDGAPLEVVSKSIASESATASSYNIHNVLKAIDILVPTRFLNLNPPLALTAGNGRTAGSTNQ